MQEKTGSKRTNELEESEVIALARKKNERAFLEIYNRYKDGLRYHVGKVVPSWDVDDVCMQTFLKAFMHIDAFDPEKGEFRTWLYTIGWNSALDHIGKKKRDSENMPTSSIDSESVSAAKRITAEESTMDEKLGYQEDYEKVLRYIEQLDERYRDIARDRFIGECEYSEIAENYGLGINTVKTRIKRAREALMKMMDSSDEIMQ